MADNNNVNEKGGISVTTEHIFPIIKKWLYSEKEIFLREIVSNACDAVTKLKRLISLGEIHDIDENFRIDVILNRENRTLTVSDNGIGMNTDELRRYICQIALSGALEFIQKYEGGEQGQSPAGIIGHFGLGFYSSFMVSDRVELVTRSCDGSPAVHWSCNEAGEYEISSDASRASNGTDVIMHIAEGEDEFLESSRIRAILDKYCAFMPIEIYYDDLTPAPEPEKDENGEPKPVEPPKPINDTKPLWTKNPSDCTDEEYLQFYRKVFNDWREPLFQIHINADYPLNFKGILYFPRLNHEYDSLEGQVKLYYNQVFVADNIKEVIPEFMLMLKGVVDCPELPLNVSRSYLQNSGYVAKMSAHIVKKVSDKLNSLFTLERERYEKLWGDIKLFVEYGSLRDRKFYERVQGSLLLPITDGSHKTLSEYLEGAKAHENTVYYANDAVTQAQYIALYNAQGIDVALLDRLIDNQFISMLEQDKNIKFFRVDSDIADAIKGEGGAEDCPELAELFKKEGGEKLTVRFDTLKDSTIPVILNISEQDRRFEDMMKMYRHDAEDDGIATGPATLIVNTANPLIAHLCDDARAGSGDAEATVRQLYMLALLGQRRLTADELKSFLTDSYGILERRYGV